MKKILVVMTLALLLVGVTNAQPIAVDNFSFELPGTGKTSDFTTVPGWDGISGGNECGVESTWAASDGDWNAYFGDNTGCYQLTGHTIAAGEEFTLTVDLSNTWNSTGATIELYYDDAGTQMTMGSLFYAMSGSTSGPDEVSLAGVFANDTPASIGNNIGILISTADAWVGADNVRLDIVPEPATLALLGLGGLGLIRRRRK